MYVCLSYIPMHVSICRYDLVFESLRIMCVFQDFDCKVEFFTSQYLVDQEVGSNHSQPIIRLDRMDRSERRWRKANVLVFNTGHWWTSDKIGDG